MHNMTSHKRHVHVTLDIICYDDLNVNNFDWVKLLQLEGDEYVDVNIQEMDYSYY